MDSFEDLMNQYGEEFDNAEASDFSEEVPDGQYLVHVNKATIGQAKSSGRWQVAWDFSILWDPRGRYVNRHIFTYYGLTTVDKVSGKHTPNKVGMSILKSGLRKVGIDNVNKDNIPESLSKVIGKVVLVDVKTKGEFTNVNLVGKYADSVDSFKAPMSLQDVQQKLSTSSSSASDNVITQTIINPGNVPPLQFED